MKKKLLSLSLIAIVAAGLLSPHAVFAQETLKFGIMPATDSIPLLWAEEKGYFEEEGVEVELIGFTNGANRTTAMQTGELDGDLEGLTEYLNSVEQDPSIGKIISTTNDQFVLIKAAEAKDPSKEEVKVGSFLNSVVHYLTYKEFESAVKGYTEEFIPEIPLRIQMLAQNQIDYAILPEPIASSAVAQGLERSEISVDEDVNVYVFRADVLDNHAQEVKAFIKAYNQAIADLQDQANLTQAKTLLVEKFELPVALVDLMTLPTFKEAALPDQAYVETMQSWLSQEFDQEYNTTYEDLVFDASAE